jgi:hypothetical protein
MENFEKINKNIDLIPSFIDKYGGEKYLGFKLLFEWDIQAIRKLYVSFTQKSDLQLSLADEGLLDRIATCLDRLATHMGNPGRVRQYLVWIAEYPKLQALQKETLEFTQRFGGKVSLILRARHLVVSEIFANQMKSRLI